MTASSSTSSAMASAPRLLAALMEAPSVLVAIVAPTGAVLSCNERFATLFRLDPVQPSVQSVPELMQFAAGGEATDEVRFQTAPSGAGARLVRLSLSRQPSPVGEDSILVIGHDVTERLGLCATPDSVQVPYETRLATDIAHEINQPLSVIRMAAENALAELEPDLEAASEDDVASGGPSATADAVKLRTFLASKLHRIMSQVDMAALTITKMRSLG